MSKMKSVVKNYLVEESGATAVEYGLIAGLLGISILTGVSKIAANSDSAWDNVATKVEAVD